MFGTIANDITARDRQAVPHPGGWEYASAPARLRHLGAARPWIVTRDEIPDPQDLSLRTDVNEEIRQSNSTAKMIWSVAEIVAFFSHFYTLQPGMLETARRRHRMGHRSRDRWQAVRATTSSARVPPGRHVVRVEIDGASIS